MAAALIVAPSIALIRVTWSGVGGESPGMNIHLDRGRLCAVTAAGANRFRATQIQRSNNGGDTGVDLPGASMPFAVESEQVRDFDVSAVFTHQPGFRSDSGAQGLGFD